MIPQGISLASRLNKINIVEVQERACCVLFYHQQSPEHKTRKRNLQSRANIVMKDEVLYCDICGAQCGALPVQVRTF